MKIPGANSPECLSCASPSVSSRPMHSYDMACHGCFIRMLAHMPGEKRTDTYERIERQHGHDKMTTIKDAVTKHFKQKNSWGTFAK